MDENREEYHGNQGIQDQSSWESRTGGINRGLLLGAVTLLIVAGLAFGYGYRQQIAVGHLTAQQSVSSATIDQLQGQLNTVNTKLNDMVAAQQAAPEASAQKKTYAAGPGTKHGTPVADKRYKELKAQLEDEVKQLKETQELVAKNRTYLETSLSSTKDELNGSIAKTHDELVVLQRRGERNYFEFDLTKSKQFQRFGPLTLSLRRTDTKHMNYDLMMVVDDNALSKKRVNLYEPIWIHTESAAQPVQIVVSRISKNEVRGYISAPKYKESELAAASTGRAMLTPVSDKTTGDLSRPYPPPQQQQEQQPQAQPQTPQQQPSQPESPRPQM
ncbi:MAG TPA: hypothetical protein VNB49_10800 [Candidatus Dormibacteraeota bacterium]|nr:hypothetical protein [Candidatus Dormibacteraeota bacterium]